MDLFIFLVGLVVGSFLNVCIYRLPRGESLVRPGSHCPSCQHPIAWFDNLPILSFFILRGHCRHCRERISFRYPLVELASGLVWYGSWQGSEGTPIFWIRVIFVSLLLVVSLTDLETGLIPDEGTLFGTVAGVAASLLYPELQKGAGDLLFQREMGSLQGFSLPLAALGRSALGLVVGGGLIWLTGRAGNWMFQKELKQLRLDQSMGGGDMKLLAMAGSFLGPEKVLLSFFTAPLLGLPFALYSRFAKKEKVIPYGPFLSLAAAVQFFFGDTFWRLFIFGA